MKKKALNFIGRKLYSYKIKSYEKKYMKIYNEDYKDIPIEEFAMLCLYCETEEILKIQSSTGIERMEYRCSLQANYNLFEREFNYVEEIIKKTPSSELKYFFNKEYAEAIENIKDKEFNAAMEIYINFGKIANDKLTKNYLKWHYVKACLGISAIEEVFGDEINSLTQNLISTVNRQQ